MRYRLKDVLPWGKPKTPGFGISKNFYLSVLANSPTLPPLIEVVSPKGEGGTVAGFGVPLTSGSSKDDVSRPMKRGTYAIASPDQKTVLRLVVVSKEEAGFDPAPLLQSPEGLSLPDDIRSGVLAAWNLLQVSFESHHPEVFPALEFMLQVTRKLAEKTDAVIADPISRRYVRPKDLIGPKADDHPVAVQDFVSVNQVNGENGIHTFTLGLQKFGITELEFTGVDSGVLPIAQKLLISLAHTLLTGHRFEPGDRIGQPAMFQAASGGLDRKMWGGVPVQEILPLPPADINQRLLEWEGSLK